jgi:3-methyladenine DNA glycosylase AlkD
MHAQISATLKQIAESTPASLGTFFKTGPGDYAEHDQFIGVSVPTLRRLTKEFQHIGLDNLRVLLHSKINEERLFSLIVLTNRYAAEPNAIYQLYMDNLNHVNNWNLVDASAHLIVGKHLHKADKNILLTLANSTVMWERRVAIVATWYFIKMNQFEWTLKLAKVLLTDSHDLIHKAVGWMLREMGKKDIKPLTEFLNQHAATMPRTMLRYAIEKFPEAERQHFLKCT